ncbi:hypothetical protein PVL29_020882 [Vitis rotundifolia]|uniref:Uncharacterized protein n=1 Tax=Vitis rotundifolia TaxID=103349 RepID=A0AA38YY28_VITRO|nr:hypothetical protein PVL29_020867 [Vitis rotundifolia]KAJ9678816.1 hypothetical protein PVL29_020882 [Vitis rotundifolia]
MEELCGIWLIAVATLWASSSMVVPTVLHSIIASPWKMSCYKCPPESHHHSEDIVGKSIFLNLLY